MIQIKNLTKTYNAGKSNEFTALSNINLVINEGESVAIVGKSGAGKSTLLHILAGIDKASSGCVLVDDVDIEQFNDAEQAAYRNKTIGIVMQEFFLIKNATVLDNVLLPLTYVKMKNIARIEKATELIYGVNLDKHVKKMVYTLSGGEKQRVAIARALVNDPKLLLADEPTGSLDSENGDSIIDMLMRINQKGKTLIIITHDYEIARRCGRIIELKDGRLTSDMPSREITPTVSSEPSVISTESELIAKEKSS